MSNSRCEPGQIKFGDFEIKVLACPCVPRNLIILANECDIERVHCKLHEAACEVAKEMATYCGFQPNQIVRISGTPYDGSLAMIRRWQKIWGEPRLGLVPVFIPDHPATEFWWVHPNQLKRVLSA